MYPLTREMKYPLEMRTVASHVSLSSKSKLLRIVYIVKLSTVGPRRRLFVPFDDLCLLHREADHTK